MQEIYIQTSQFKPKRLLTQNAPLLLVLAGFLLAAFSLGPFNNGDTAWELDSTSGVLRSGLPYANGSYLIDQPPVGFYLQAGWAQLFGLSISSGTFFTALAGAGCIVLVYILGLLLYDRLTATLAAALMAFSPWHLILSRAFLIDVQCLFFSLLSLVVAVYAFKKGSFGLFLASGMIFAVAFNTKLYAVFALVPILTLFLLHRPKKLSHSLGWLAAFGLPTLAFSYLWYQTITGISMSSIILHADFFTYNAPEVVPSYWFAVNFVTNYGVGWIFVATAMLSLAVGAAFRPQFPSFLTVDLICIATIIAVLAADTILGTTFNLRPPYQNAVKYCYQALPFLALLAASVVRKSLILVNSSKNSTRLRRAGFWVLGAVGLFLVGDALTFNMRYVNLISGADFVIFRVQPGADMGYSFFDSTPLSAGSELLLVQYVGFTLSLFGLFWLSRNRLKQVLNR
jgi:4-amino-4-deoxy-L-arabinose transferase-like glycosyltransferase